MKHEKKRRNITRMHLFAWCLLVVATAEVFFIPEISEMQLTIAYAVIGLLLATIIICLASLSVYYFTDDVVPAEQPDRNITEFSRGSLQSPPPLVVFSRRYLISGLNKFLLFFKIFN